MIVQTDEQREAEIERRVSERMALVIESMPSMVGDSVDRALDKAAAKNAAAMEQVLRKMAADQELMNSIANSFQTHYLRTWREWLGGKIWNFLLYGILGAVLTWLSVQQLFGKGKP